MPPDASLAGLAESGSTPGSLGTYTWGGSGSDAPWIVGKGDGSTHAGRALSISFGGFAPASWTAAWALVRHGAAGSPVAAASGSGPAAVTAPAEGGDWTLRVTAAFGPGASATYYWRITVTP